jgi:DNA-binding response OmpR family regulator
MPDRDVRDCGVLIVDDDPSVQQALTLVLREGGYRHILVASNGTEALSVLAAEGEHVFAILLDLLMPGINGPELIRHLVNIHGVPVGIIIVTAHPRLMSREAFFKMAAEPLVAIDYISKPFEATRVLADVAFTVRAVDQKREALRLGSFASVHSRLEKIEASVNNLYNQKRGFLAEIGLDLLRTLIISAALVAFLLFGPSEWIKSIVAKVSTH